jgi:hypothetical protein
MPGFWRQMMRRWCPAPETERVAAVLEAVRADRDRRRRNQKPQPDGQQAPWLDAVDALIDNARQHYEAARFQAAWQHIKAAERAMLNDPEDEHGVIGQAILLRREAEEIPGRRGNAIKDLLSDAAGNPRADLLAHRPLVIEAARLRDDYFDTQYYRLELRRRHLINVFFVLVGGLALLVFLARCGKIELFAGQARTLVAVILFGMLGAALSVAQSLVSGDVKQKAPMQLMGSFMIWLRPVVGGTAAVIAYVLVLANQHLKVFFDGRFGTELTVVIVIAVVAGFSERFIVGAMSSIADTQARKAS